MLIGYARVSTQEQETHAQIDALTRAGVEVIHEEKRSGGDRKRPVLAKVLAELGPGDTLVVYKLDRIARSLSHLLEVIELLDRTGASFRSLTETIDTGTPAGRMMVHILGAFAEFERELIRERTRVGMRAAVERGSRPGRPRALTPQQEADCLRRWSDGSASLSALARLYGVHLSSVKRAIRRLSGEEVVAVTADRRRLGVPLREPGICRY